MGIKIKTRPNALDSIQKFGSDLAKTGRQFVSSRKEAESLDLSFSIPDWTKYVVATVTGIAVGATVVFFFSKYTLSFQTPVIFQTPVKINTRQSDPVPVINNEPEATGSAEMSLSIVPQVYAAEPTPAPVFKRSKKASDCVFYEPEMAGRILSRYDEPEMALELICRESSLREDAINKSSGACGLGQALPCSKMKCELSDIECQFTWIENYVVDRYGTFAKAVAFHNKKGWY